MIFFYGPRHEGTPIFILARVGAKSRLFGAERKIKPSFKLWIREEYTLKSIHEKKHLASRAIEGFLLLWGKKDR